MIAMKTIENASMPTSSSSSSSPTNNGNTKATIVSDEPEFLFHNILLNRTEIAIILDLSARMRDGLTNETIDRRWKLKIYKKCFLATDVFTWLKDNFDVSSLMFEENTSLNPDDAENLSSEDAAIAMANEILRAGYIHHVKNEHWFSKDELKNVLFFRFNEKLMDFDIKEIQSKQNTIHSIETRTKLSLHRSNSVELRSSIIKMKSSDSQGLHENEISSVFHHITATNTKVERLSQAMMLSTKALDECRLKIDILEKSISALAAAFLVLVIFYADLIMSKAVDIQHGYIVCTIIVPLFIYLAFQPDYVRDRYHVGHQSILWNIFRRTLRNENLTAMSEIDDDESMCSQDQANLQNTPSSLSSLSPSKFKSNLSTILHPNNNRDNLFVSLQIQLRDASDLPPPTSWPHHPCLLCLNTPAFASSEIQSPHYDGNGNGNGIKVPVYGDGPCPIGTPFPFESDLFQGTLLIRIKGLATSDNVKGDQQYFDERKRVYQMVIQGRFKEELLLSDVLTGHEFTRPLKSLPPPFVLNAATSMMRRIAQGAEININSKQPYFMAPLASTSQIISADMPGNEPNILCNDIQEDCALFGGLFQHKHVSSSRRKKLLANPKVACQYKYDTESIYTFDFYQKLLDVSTYNLNLGFASLSMHKRLDGQPIQAMAKTRDGRYLWSFQLWHEKLLSCTN